MRETLTALLFAVYIAFGKPLLLLSPECSGLIASLVYPLFHANIFHLAANIVSVWTVFAPGRTSAGQIITAYLISAAVYPLATLPVVGISNMLFAMCGLRTPDFKNPWWKSGNFILFAITTLVLGFFQQFSTTTHIAAFILGAAIAAGQRKFKKTLKEAGYND